MSVLTLDLARRVGWASFHPAGRRHASGSFLLPWPQRDGMKVARAHRYRELHQYLERINTEDSPIITPSPVRTLVVERHRGGMKTVETSEALMGYLAIAEWWAYEHGVEVYRVNATSMKMHVTDKGNASKDDMMAAARKRWRAIDISGDDEADALHLGRCYFDGVVEP